ncbi:diguanylate cyclase/phosphodiesterase (GGDEF & EAL domains) with PAS/PAC sensor(s), partial [hydrothermal vent metagenome]
MNIKRRFLLATISIALVVLFLFGGVAYYIARDTEILKETALLQTQIKATANALSDQSLDQKTRDDYFKFLAKIYKSHTYILILRDQNGDIITDTDILPPTSGLTTELTQIGPPKFIARSGNITIKGQNYPWAAAPLQQGNIELLVVHKPQTAETPLIETITSRFIIAGLIVIWIAVWAALILASVFTKRIHAHHAELQYRASHDGLTQLPNRSLLLQRLEKSLVATSLQNQQLALLVMDLDHFKEVNDTLGHPVGDQLLLQISHRVSAVLRNSDTVARLGGDEFSVLLPNTRLEHAILCVEKISAALNKSFIIEENEISTRFSIGIAMFPEHGHAPDTLLKYADIAMYQAKRNNTGYSIYNAEHDSYTLQRLTLARELCTAIEEGQLTLYYQPKIDIPTGKVNGAEALVRWQHPEQGIILPDEFIGIAEQSGLIDTLAYWVIEAAIKQCQKWRASGLKIKIAINLSASNLHNTKLPDWIEKKLNQYDLPAEMLELELTEN